MTRTENWEVSLLGFLRLKIETARKQQVAGHEGLLEGRATQVCRHYPSIKQASRTPRGLATCFMPMSNLHPEAWHWVDSKVGQRGGMNAPGTSRSPE